LTEEYRDQIVYPSWEATTFKRPKKKKKNSFKINSRKRSIIYSTEIRKKEETGLVKFISKFKLNGSIFGRDIVVSFKI